MCCKGIRCGVSLHMQTMGTSDTEGMEIPSQNLEQAYTYAWHYGDGVLR